ncbi:MgtC/SapB family protein [Chitinophaga japonensis]|uniref:Putative Mg2+ transporter-C (MgtC) family protein n=1 Tax=Chitinophaga japonensis TaxID=104662 RepID=A0A562TF39_CHIJA|nr:MgtC/SapB family protein [Chitinophaga japonensis]TWI91888.1 putative Mg2+ transporter-C (MgtC) family protein [Chitinophaga japonensis]
MIETTEIILRLATAAVLGGLVGLDRERLEWAAGLRTHMLVCLGSTLAMIVSAYGFEEVLGHENVELDPSRIASLVISGIGFIGAGTILFIKRKVIYGLTTAAGLWTVAAVGLAVGGGMYWAAIAATLITLVILTAIKHIENKFFSNIKDRSIRISFQHASLTMSGVSQLLQQHKVDFDEITLQRPEKGYIDELEIVINKSAAEGKVLAVIDTLKEQEGVKEVSYSNI